MSSAFREYAARAMASASSRGSMETPPFHELNTSNDVITT